MRKQNENPDSSPVIRVRFMGLWVALLVALISGPLLAVWKQVYINDTSIKINKLSDSLSVLQKEIATLQFTCEQYSSTERIEKIARSNLHLDYPLSSQIVVIGLENQNRYKISDTPREILAYLKKSIIRDRG